MKKILTILSILLLLYSAKCMAQGQSVGKIWGLENYNGEVRLNSYYRSQIRIGNQIDERQQSIYFSGGISFKSNSYIWHPRFMTIFLEGDYSPARQKENYLVIPDEVESNNLRKYEIKINLFPQSRFSLISYYNNSHLDANRENLSSLRSKGTNYGSIMYAKTGKIPFSVGYTGSTLNELELQTGRSFQYRQDNLEARVNLISNSVSKQEGVVSRNHYYRKDYGGIEVSNQVDNVTYNGSVLFGKKKIDNVSGFLSAVSQSGFETFTRYQCMQQASMEFFRRLHATERYRFFDERRHLFAMLQHSAGASLNHQLFESLHSQINYDYTISSHSVYTEKLHQANVELNYIKKLFRKHELELTYKYAISMEKWESKDQYINVVNEAITLKDGQITLLSRPYITLSSVQIKDNTGTIIYQPNVDYLLIAQKNYLQVVRIAGGLIPDNTMVYADFISLQPGSYQYQSTNHLVSAGLSFFNRKLGIYGRYSTQDYLAPKNTDLMTLNYFDQHVLGIKANFRFAGAGAEYDRMNSTVLPYTVMRYYVNVQGLFLKRILVSVNGNVYDYSRLNTLSNIIFADANSSVSYAITNKMNLMTSFSYRKQIGENMNLDLFNIRSQFTMNIEKLRLSLIYNYYNRMIEKEQIRFNAINIQLSRAFR